MIVEQMVEPGFAVVASARVYIQQAKIDSIGSYAVSIFLGHSEVAAVDSL